MVGTSPPRIGIVGLGHIGHYHAARLEDLEANVVGGVDPSDAARDRFAGRYGARTYETFDGLYEHGVDAVVVTTPNRYHERYTVACLERDLPVLVEKPLAHTLESAERILAAANASDAFGMVGFHKRFLDGAEVVKDRVARNELGELHHVEANYVRRRGIPGRGGWFTREAVSGGGALVDIGVHALDLAFDLLDFPPVENVDATLRSEFGGRENYTYLEMSGEDQGPDRWDVEDAVRAFLRTTTGASVSLNAIWAGNQPDDTTITLTGSQGGACLDHETGELELYTVADASAPQLLTTKVETRNEDPHRKQLRTFVDAVAEGVPPGRNTVEQGYFVQNVVDAIYQSAESGASVHPSAAAQPNVLAD